MTRVEEKLIVIFLFISEYFAKVLGLLLIARKFSEHKIILVTPSLV